MLLRLQAGDQGVRFGGFGDRGRQHLGGHEYGSSFASGLESGGTQHASCMLSFVEAHGTYEYVCDRHEVVDGAAAAQPKKVTLRPKRIAVEHGFVCAVRKRGKFNASVFEGNFGARPAVVVSRCMTESSALGKQDKECLAEAGADELWVPTRWHAGIYREAAAGLLPPERIIVMPEIVDTDFFSRAAAAAAAAASARAGRSRNKNRNRNRSTNRISRDAAAGKPQGWRTSNPLCSSPCSSGSGGRGGRAAPRVLEGLPRQQQ